MRIVGVDESASGSARVEIEGRLVWEAYLTLLTSILPEATRREASTTSCIACKGQFCWLFPSVMCFWTAVKLRPELLMSIVRPELLNWPGGTLCTEPPGRSEPDTGAAV